MRTPCRILAPLMLAGAVATAAPPGAVAHPAPPSALVSGSDVVVLRYPSLVKVRVTRTRRALRKAVSAFDDGDAATGARKLATVRRQLAAAWRGARHVIRTTPPPPPAEDRLAHVSGDGPTGPVKASPADVAVLVLGLQHRVASAMIQSTEDVDDAALDGVGTTLHAALDGRDGALADIERDAPPAPPAEDRRAHASGDGPVASTFDTVMPDVASDMEDELQAIGGLTSDSTDLTAAGRRLLEDVTGQIAASRKALLKAWPPVPVED